MKTTAEGALIAREGLPFIAIAAGLWLLGVVLGWMVFSWVTGLLTLWVVWFFRSPKRVVPTGHRLVIAPADGVVLHAGADPGTEGGLRVCTFMNVFNVHVNRYPVDGEVTDITYTPGKFFNASFDKASEHNERNAVTMTTAEGHSVRFVQIAGLVARRIVHWTGTGVIGQKGDIFGLIRFGSRVDVHLPSGTEVWVRPGQKVVAGESILGRLPE